MDQNPGAVQGVAFIQRRSSTKLHLGHTRGFSTGAAGAFVLVTCRCSDCSTNSKRARARSSCRRSSLKRDQRGGSGLSQHGSRQKRVAQTITEHAWGMSGASTGHVRGMRSTYTGLRRSRATLKGEKKGFVMPTETNVHGDALCFMVKTWATTETALNNGWRLTAPGGWRLRLAAGGGWRLVAVGGWWLVAVGGWWLAVGGPWEAVLKGCP